MPERHLTLLVVGAGGLLGRHVVEVCREEGITCIAASSRPGADCTLDIDADIGPQLDRLPARPTHALLCPAISSLDACARDPGGTGRFNVDRICATADALAARDVVPIFCSSDLVFRGDRGNYTEDDPREPTTTYGRQKMAVEDHLAATCPSALVLRFSKLYSLAADDPSPVGSTMRALRAGRRVCAAHDQVVVPTWARDAAVAACRLSAAGASGAFHVTAAERFTRLSLALAIASAVGGEDLVEPCSIADFTFDEPRPKNNSLSGERLARTLGLRFARLAETLPAALAAQPPAEA